MQGAEVVVLSLFAAVTLYALISYVRGTLFGNCGVYGFKSNGKWLYVGKSVDVHKRRKQHERDGRMFVKGQFKVLWTGPHWRLSEMEVYYIRKLKPTQNKIRYVSSRK